MKRFLAVMAIVFCTIPSMVIAHSGGTDSAGGHHDYNNVSGLGSYHYHHGYGPHLHENGVCPYDTSSYDADSSISTSYYDDETYSLTESELDDIIYNRIVDNPDRYDVVPVSEYEELKRDYEQLKSNSIDKNESADDVLAGVGLTAAAGAAGCYYIYRKYNK